MATTVTGKKIQETAQDAPAGAAPTGRYSKEHDAVIAQTKPISDYLDISEHGLVDVLVRPVANGGLGDTVAGCAGLINSFQEGTDYGSGTHNTGGTDKLMARVRYFRGEVTPGGDPSTPVKPPTYVNFGWVFTDQEVTDRMRNGVNQAGDVLDYAEFVRRTRMFEGRGNVWANEGVDDHLFEVLYRNGTITRPYPGDGGVMPPDPSTPFIGQTLQQWLDVQKGRVGYGPSGVA